MRSTPVNSAAFFLAAFFAVSALAWDQEAMRDSLTDDFISPWCRVDSPDSWEGRPCVIPLRTGSAGESTEIR
jgi:hypothetical protein